MKFANLHDCLVGLSLPQLADIDFQYLEVRLPPCFSNDGTFVYEDSTSRSVVDFIYNFRPWVRAAVNKVAGITLSQDDLFSISLTMGASFAGKLRGHLVADDHTSAIDLIEQVAKGGGENTKECIAQISARSIYDNNHANYSNARAYGSKSALCVTASKSRLGFQTVNIDIATKLPTQSKSYDWKNKTFVQLSESELASFFAVCMGWVDAYEVKGHGVSHEKRISIKHQGDGIFIMGSGGSAESPKCLPVCKGDLFFIKSLVLNQICLNFPTLTSDTVLTILKSDYA